MIRANWWLRDVVSSANFANVNSTGNANYNNASNANIGVRPDFGYAQIPSRGRVIAKGKDVLADAK